VSRTTVYKHFPQRADLLRGAIESFDTGPAVVEVTGDLRADLRNLVGHLAMDLADDARSRVFAALIERAMHDPEVAEVRDGLMADGLDAFGEIVGKAVAAGELRPDIDVDLALAGLIGVFFAKRFLMGSPVGVDRLDHVIDEFIAIHRPR
jgi:AcrR family transcriptional regulator